MDTNQRVTVVFSDNAVYVGQECLQFPFDHPENLHAIQWHNGKGHIEYEDHRPNTPLSLPDYDTVVRPYAVLFFQEQQRRLLAEETAKQ